LFPKRIYPTRGIIYDRRGLAILNNTIMYDLMVTPSQVKTMDTAYFCALEGIDTAEFRDRMLDARLKNGPFRPSIFDDLLPPELYAKLEENIWQFPGFNLQERPVRVYPFNAGAHIMGYVGEVDSLALRRNNSAYQMGDYIGKTGLEQYYEPALMGQRGIEFWIKDNKNRLVGHYENRAEDTPAVAGRNLHTYMDIELQQLAEKLMRNKVGAIVAIEPQTGGILAMVSSPDYDPNLLTGSDKQENFNHLFLDQSSPLFNRAIKGLYPAGSTYKPLGALIGLDEGVITPASGYDCHGVYYGCPHPVKCEEKAPGHAANLRLAIANSCNSFFSNTLKLIIDNPEFHSARIGLMKWKAYVNAFGLGHRLGVDLPSEDAGVIPDTTVYDKEYHHQWNSCTMVGGGLGIGQDKMVVTPLQMANAMCIVANKGFFYTPHFVEKIDGEPADDTLLDRFQKRHYGVSHITDEDYNVVMSGMQDVVEFGTAHAARIPGINICAKTGTGQNKRVIDGRVIELPNNSMFVCFAPREDPKIAVAVVVENAGHGATWAAPIASLLLEKYLRDTLSEERTKLAQQLSETNLMPKYLVRVQFRSDSLRAVNWARQTGDSSRLIRYQDRSFRAAMEDTIHRVITQELLQEMQRGVLDKPKESITAPDTSK
jgi:penicillin-binding protein 2